MNRILILLASLLVLGNVYALPPCPASGVFHNCFGTFTFASGNEYVGEWKDDKKHGYGTFRFVDGGQHVGEYKDDKPNGHGTYTWADGDKYVGEYKDGKPHGHGTYIWADGDKYVGEYKDGKPWEGIEYSASGKVQETYLNGEPCTGCEPTARQLALVREIDPSLITAALPPCPSSGVFHNCFGAFTFDDGDKYVGEWKEDQMHGHGIYTWANGEKYIGEFRDGRNTYGVQYSALGRLQGTFSNGEWCEECEPNANQLALVREIDPSLITAALPPCPTSGYFDNCFGTAAYEDGDKYVGEYKDDKRHGHGTYIFGPGEFEGDKYVGEWKDDNPWEGIEYSASDKVQGTYSNGEWCEECEPNANQLALVREIDPSLITLALPPCPTSGYFDNCFGAYMDADGNEYVGEWKDNKRHGHGASTFADGDQHVGEYKDGKPHGQGAYTWADGDKYVGEYKDGSAWTGITYDKNGSVVSKLTEGVRTTIIREDKNVMDDTNKK